MKVKNKQEIDKILKWVEWRNIDVQFDLFDEGKLRDNPMFDKYLKNV